MDKRLIFSNYNTLKYQIPDIYLPRLNRALGIAQLKNPRPYVTSLTNCSCPDHFYRNVVCKHMLALWLQQSNALSVLQLFDIFSE